MVDPKKLFVWNVSWGINNDSFKEIFTAYWAIVDQWTRIVMDKQTWRSKGFGFVVFENEEDAKRAKEELDGKDIDGRPLRVDFAVVREENR